MVVSSFAIGVLAIPVFGLNFIESALVIAFINVLGILPVCFFSTFGPKFGLRQVVLSRFYFGYYGVRISEAPPPPFLPPTLVKRPRAACRAAIYTEDLR